MSSQRDAGASYDRMWSDVYGDMQDVGPAHRHMRRILRGLLADAPFRSVLEVGCGAGHNLPMLAEHTRLENVCGTDVSEAALQRAQAAFSGATFEHLDIEQRCLNGAWDLIFCSLVLEHLSDDESALANMRSMTSGRLVVSTIAGDFDRYRPWEEQVGHVRNYRRGELESKLRRAGFEVERAIYWGAPFYSPLMRTVQNRASASAGYGPLAKVVARLLYFLYWLNLSSRGDLLLITARAV